MAIQDKVEEHYGNLFGKDFISVFSPGRINIIGEHTDYNEGFVFPAAIDKGIYVAMGKSGSNKSTVHALDMGESLDFSASNLYTFEVGSWKNYIIGVVSEIEKKGKSVSGFNAVFSGDIPNGSGLSSSAALENGFVFGLNELFGLQLTKEEMIHISQMAEHNYVGVKCGIMDQYASMFGQKGKALLLDCRSISSIPFLIDLKDYELLLINTNVKHTLSDSAYNNRRQVCEEVASMLHVRALRDASENDLSSLKEKISEEDFQKALYVVQEIDRAQKASEALKNDDLEVLGQLLFETHEGLKRQYQVSCDELDFLVDKAKNNDGVIGARMMGGGFGGCTINIVHKDSKNIFKMEIAKDYKNKFGVECSFYDVSLEDGTHLL